jgi:hypothetical protein
VSRPARAAVRLGLVMFLVGLATSRIGVLVHEFVGHGALAHALGGTVNDYHLFLFGGGYVRYTGRADWSGVEQVLVSMGGIVLELGVGAAALVVGLRLPRPSVGALMVLGFAAATIVHGLFYLATGTHHGYGDGWRLHHLLGSHRIWLVAGAAVAVLATGAWFAARIAELVEPWLPERRPLAALAGAVLLAATAHGALTIVELRWQARAQYQAAMTPESTRRVTRALAEFQKTPRTAEQVAAARRALERRYRSFPLRPVLGVALVIAVLAGATRGLRRRTPSQALGWGALRGPAAVAVAALLAVLLVKLGT